MEIIIITIVAIGFITAVECILREIKREHFRKKAGR